MINWFSDSITKVIISLATTLVMFFFGYLWWVGRHRLWSRWTWMRLAGTFAVRRRWNGRGLKIVTITDYVYILERLRQSIVAHCDRYRGSLKPTITVNVLTMQLPSDWPLWEANGQEDGFGRSPLEKYYDGFRFFLQNEPKSYDVKVKRVIVIGAAQSPRGKKTFAQLRRDVKFNSEAFRKYIAMLHVDDSDACFYSYQRNWPGWMSDAVFYGLTEPNKAIKWLWAVTTSYNVGEDLILLRLHRLGAGGVSKHLTMPCGLSSLEKIANLDIIRDGMKPLSALGEIQ